MREKIFLCIIICFTHCVCATSRTIVGADSIIILKAGNLQMIDQNGTLIKTLMINEKVLNFCWQTPESVIFTTLNKKNLDVYQYNLQNEASKKILTLKNKTKEDEYWGAAGVNAILSNKGQLYIKCDYQTDQEFFYYGALPNMVYIVDMSKQQAVLKSYSEIYKRPKGPFSVAQIKTKSGLAVLTDCELYYNNDKRLIKISNTPYEKMLDRGEWCIQYDISPDGKKVVFYTLEAEGDLQHGRMLIVNIDGTNQTELRNDFWGFIGYASLSSDYSYVNGFNASNDEALYAVTSTNKLVEIAQGFEKFLLCSTNCYKYFSDDLEVK